MFEGISSIIRNVDWPSIIIGALIGVVLPIVGRFFISLFKSHKEKYHISLYQRGSSKNYSSIKNDDITVNVEFKGKAFTGTLSVVDIGLINDGQNDISYINHFDRPIVIKSEKFKIIDAHYIGNERIKASVKLEDDGSVSVEWGILKRDERIVLQLIGEEREDNVDVSFFDSLRLSVRSDCVDYIAPRRVSFKHLAVYSLLLAILMGCIQYFTLGKDTPQSYLFNHDNQTIVGYLEYDDSLSCYNIIPKESKDSLKSISSPPLFDFKRHPKVAVTHSWNPFVYAFGISFIMWVVFLIISAVVILYENRKQSKKMVFDD